MEEPNSLITHFTAAITARDPILTADTRYIELFWLPYLTSPAYLLWRVLIGLQVTIREEKLARWPSIDQIGRLMGDYDRRTILGRAAIATRPAQAGVLDRLVEEQLVVYWIVGEQANGRRYSFQVQAAVPMLTPTQAAALPAPVGKMHRKFLQASGVWERWQKIKAASLVRPPGTG